MKNNAASETATDFDGYRWKNRLVLLFAPSRQNKLFKDQKALLSNSQYELTERDIVILEYVEGRNSPDAWERFAIEPGAFHFVLVGKDGGVKLHSTSVVDPQELFNLIDAMPMRQREMRQKQEGKSDR